MKTDNLYLTAVLLALLLVGCAHPTDVRTLNLPADAFTVPVERLHEVTLEDGSIEAANWGASIRALNPVRVYRDRVNVAVVTFESAREERGVYFYVSSSSYLPVDEAGRCFRWNDTKGIWEYSFHR